MLLYKPNYGHAYECSKVNDHGLEMTHRLRQTLRWWKLYCLCVLPIHLIGHVYSVERADDGNVLWTCQSILRGMNYKVTCIFFQTGRPVLDEIKVRTWHASKDLTLRSPSNEGIDALIASSVNSGNSFKQFKKTATSVAKASNCSGKISMSRVSLTTGRTKCRGALGFATLSRRR